MNIPHPKFCVLPWVSLETSPIGTVRPCCLAEDELTDNEGNKFDLNTASFGAIQNSNSMRTLREQFIAGEQPQTCRKCWREERSSRTSKRMHTLDRLKHMIDSTEWTAAAKPLMFLDLKLGNICNLKCRICGSWSSSTFATEELANLGPDKDRKANHHYQMLRAGAWPRKNPRFWSEIAQVSDQIKYIEFTGGEPFMIQEHFDLLQGLVNQGLASGIEIHYNTNGTQWPESGPAIWRHFKHVEIAFSIDDVGERFEYQRTGASWAQVQATIEQFKLLRSQHTNITLQVCSTVNVFNVLYLTELAAWNYAQGFDYVYWNIMHEAYYFSISTLPEEAKRGITVKLRTSGSASDAAPEFEKIIDFMNAGASLDGSNMRREIANLDRRRQQDLRLVEPEFAELIEYAGPHG